jgi:hypothetical protein
LAERARGRACGHHREVLRLLRHDWDHLERQMERLQGLFGENNSATPSRQPAFFGKAGWGSRGEEDRRVPFCLNHPSRVPLDLWLDGGSTMVEGWFKVG